MFAMKTAPAIFAPRPVASSTTAVGNRERRGDGRGREASACGCEREAASAIDRLLAARADPVRAPLVLQPTSSARHPIRHRRRPPTVGGRFREISREFQDALRSGGGAPSRVRGGRCSSSRSSCATPGSSSRSRPALAEKATAIVGPSGAGKSSLLEAIAGLRRASGRVVLDGVVLQDPARGIWLPPERRRIGYVPQDGLLFPHLSVEGNIRFGAHRSDPGEAIALFELGAAARADAGDALGRRAAAGRARAGGRLGAAAAAARRAALRGRPGTAGADPPVPAPLARRGGDPPALRHPPVGRGPRARDRGAPARGGEVDRAGLSRGAPRGPARDGGGGVRQRALGAGGRAGARTMRRCSSAGCACRCRGARGSRSGLRRASCSRPTR